MCDPRIWLRFGSHASPCASNHMMDYTQPPTSLAKVPCSNSVDLMNLRGRQYTLDTVLVEKAGHHG